jgi:hypothetical protein
MPPYLLSTTAHQPVAGEVVVTVLPELIERYGAPASTLSDTGSVYTSRFTGGRNAFEYLPPVLGIRQVAVPLEHHRRGGRARGQQATSAASTHVLSTP